MSTRTPLRGIQILRPATERPRRPSQEHGWSHFEQLVLENLENLADAIGEVKASTVDLTARMVAVEKGDAVEQATRKERDRIWGYFLGIASALFVAAVIAAVTHFTKK